MEQKPDVIECIGKLLINVDGIYENIANFIDKTEGGSDFDYESFEELLAIYLAVYECSDLAKHGFAEKTFCQGYIIQIEEIESHAIGLLVDNRKQVIYIYDALSHLHDVSFYKHIDAAISKDFCNYDKIAIPYFEQDDVSFGSTLASIILLPGLLRILAWGICLKYQNQHVWYAFLKEIAKHPGVTHENAAVFLKYVSELDPEDFTYIDATKEETTVKEIIKRSVKNHLRFSDMKERISSRYCHQLSNAEINFMNERFLKQCKKQFYEELPGFMTNNIDKISSSVHGFVDWLKQQNDVPDLLNEMKVYPLLLDCKQLMSTEEYDAFVSECKKHCLDLLLSMFQTLNSEIEFLHELKSVMRKFFICLCSTDEEEQKHVREFFEDCLKGNYQHFLDFLKRASAPGLGPLKQKAMALDDVADFIILPKDLGKMFDKLKDPFRTTQNDDCNGALLTIEGSYVSMKEINKLISGRQFYEIQIIASDMVCINADFSMPGTNLALVSPDLYVIGKQTLNISGCDGRDYDQERAKDGVNIGEHGCAGQNGGDGQDGGNVFIHAERIEKDDNGVLTIRSNGGKGGKGQTGGKGANGQDGKDGAELTQSEFDEKFPKGASLGKFFSSQIIGSIPIVPIVSESIRDGNYTKATLSNGCKVISNVFEDSFWTTFIAWFGYAKLQAYCIHYGGPGTKGVEGGMGGRGGAGGKGGYGGSIEGFLEGSAVSVERKNGKQGPKGDNGVGGLRGLDGRRGFDTGRIEPSQYRDSRNYGPARLSLYYVSKEDTDSAYCPYMTKVDGSYRYAKIRVVGNVKAKQTHARERNTHENEKQEKTVYAERQDTKSVPIAKHVVMQKYKAVCKNGDTTVAQKVDLKTVISEISRTESAKKNFHVKFKTVTPARAVDAESDEKLGSQALTIKSYLKANPQRNISDKMRGSEKIETLEREDSRAGSKTAEHDEKVKQGVARSKETDKAEPGLNSSHEGIQGVENSNQSKHGAQQQKQPEQLIKRQTEGDLPIGDSKHEIKDIKQPCKELPSEIFNVSEEITGSRDPFQNAVSEMRAIEEQLKQYPVESIGELMNLHAEILDIRQFTSNSWYKKLWNLLSGSKSISREAAHKQAGDLKSTITTKLHYSWLQKFAFDLREFERGQYQGNDIAILLIKMRLLHTNHEALKDIFGIVDVEELSSCINQHMAMTKKVVNEMCSKIGHFIEEVVESVQNSEDAEPAVTDPLGINGEDISMVKNSGAEGVDNTEERDNKYLRENDENTEKWVNSKEMSDSKKEKFSESSTERLQVVTYQQSGVSHEMKGTGIEGPIDPESLPVPSTDVEPQIKEDVKQRSHDGHEDNREIKESTGRGNMLNREVPFEGNNSLDNRSKTKEMHDDIEQEMTPEDPNNRKNEAHITCNEEPVLDKERSVLRKEIVDNSLIDYDEDNNTDEANDVTSLNLQPEGDDDANSKKLYKLQIERKNRCKDIITKFELNLKASNVEGLNDELLQSIKLLQFIDIENIEVLLETLTNRIILDRIHLCQKCLIWFLSKLMQQTESKWIKIFTWVIATNPMTKWLEEYTVMFCLFNCKLDLKEEFSLREILYGMKDSMWIPVIFDMTTKIEDVLSVYPALKMLMGNPFEDSLSTRLSRVAPSQWEGILKDHYAFKALLKLPVDWTEEEIIEADAYLDELRKIYGHTLVDRLIKQLSKGGKVTAQFILMLLKNFYHDYWQLTDSVLGCIEGKQSKDWRVIIEKECFPNEAHSLERLIQMIAADSNNSHPYHDCESKGHEKPVGKHMELKEIQSILESTLSNEKVIATFGESFVKEWELCEKISALDEDKKESHLTNVKDWTSNLKERVIEFGKDKRGEFLEENINEIFAHVEIGISLITGYKMRQTQRLSALLMLLSNDRGLLQQVSTGEGKTIIIVAFCIVKALLGHTIDVITSSSVLAKRDAEDKDNAKVYSLFEVSVSHNCSEEIDKRIEAYKKSVVYGDIGSFQRDMLLQEFYGETVLGRRQIDVLAVDEVDSMLLDKAENVLYLSHEIPDLQALEPVFVFIWSFVHGKGLLGTEDDFGLVQAAIMNAIYGSIRREDLREKLYLLEDCEAKSYLIWNYLIDKEIIDKRGRILDPKRLLANDITLEFADAIKRDANDLDMEGIVLGVLKDTVRRGTQITVPRYLDHFIDLHLMEWIRNAFKARFMQERCHYVIDINRDDIAGSQSANVIIMDTDTGKEQFNTQWNEGLHQFLQLKHGCKCSVESLKAVFISNTQFFKLYERSVYGLTGTLGSKQERDLLQSMYSSDYVTIPTFRPKRFTHYDDCIFDEEDTWLHETISTTTKIASKRPVLVICETIQDLEKFQSGFLSDQTPNIGLHVYKHSYQSLDIVKDDTKIDKGCIILATNLAGRGTDIKISVDIEKKGGLHVILTYLPRNLRVQEQAFGRAARKGEQGSGQLMVMGNSSIDGTHNVVLRMLMMIKARSAEEKIRLSLIQEHYEKSIKQEEYYFGQFKKVYAKLKDSLTQLDDEQKSILLDACLDQWAFWIDALGKSIESGKEPKEMSWLQFQDSLLKKPQSSDFLYIAQTPSSRVKLGEFLLKQKRYSEAMAVFERIICDEPNFAEGAHYFMTYAIVKETKLGNAEDKQRLTLHLFKAQEILKSRIETYSELSCMVGAVKSLYGKGIQSFVTREAYKRQKEVWIDLLSTIDNTIADILGHTIERSNLETASGDTLLARRVYENDELFQRPVFLKANDGVSTEVRKEFNDFIDDQVVKTCERYSLYAPEVRARIEELRGKPRQVKSEDFCAVLPGREEFWQVLLGSNLLYNQAKYVVINLEKLKKISALKDSMEEILRRLSKISAKSVFEAIHKDSAREGSLPKTAQKDELGKDGALEICLYPEDTEDIISGKTIAVDVKRKEELDSRYWDVFVSHDIVSCNEVAFLKTTVVDSTKLTKYDEMRCEDLLKIPGMEQQTAEEIFKLLSQTILTCPEPSKISLLELKRNKKFETEVKSLLSKHFKYREMLNKTIQDGCLPFEMLECKPHEKIWRDLIDFKVVSPTLVKEAITEDDIQTVIDNEQDALKKGFNDICYFFGFKDKSPFASTVYEWKSAMFKYDSVDVNFKDIDTLLDEKFRIEAIDELSVLTSKGFGHVVVLEEEKWSWSTIWKIIGIIVLGIAQICLAVVIEVCTLGAGTIIAEGLIGEGIGDIMFAIECAISGHCSMKEYLKQKIISICLTVVTCGVGAYFARTAKFSRFGFKVADEYATVAGKQLIEKVGKRRLAKEAIKRVGKKVGEATAMGLATAGIDKAVENLLRTTLKEGCDGIVTGIKHGHGFEQLKKSVTELYEKVGPQQAATIATQACEEELKLQFTMFINGAVKILDAFNNGCSVALKKLKKLKSGDHRIDLLTKITGTLSECLKYAPYVEGLVEMKESVDRFIFTLPNLLSEKTKSSQEGNCCEATDEGVEGIMDQLEKILTGKLEEILENKLIKPALNHQAGKFVHYAGSEIKEKYRSLEATFHKKQFEALKRQMNTEHDKKSADQEGRQKEKSQQASESIHDACLESVSHLQRRVKNPDLYADMLREGIPMGIHEAQAISNLLNAPIQIMQCDEGGKVPFQKEFIPSSGQTGNVVTVYFQPGKNGEIGHFSDKPFDEKQSDVSVSGKNNCLLDAVNNSTGQKMSREKVANIVETDPEIRERIKRGTHRHYIEKGGTGGAERSRQRKQFVEDLRKKLEERAKNMNGTWFWRTFVESENRIILTEKDEENLRDPTQHTGYTNIFGRQIKSGNHEIIGIRHVPELLLRDQRLLRNISAMQDLCVQCERSTTIKPFGWFDLNLELRVDTRYAVYHFGRDRMQGHPVSVVSNAACDSQHQLTAGSAQVLHHEVTRGSLECNTPLECARMALQGHLQAIGSRAQFENQRQQDNSYFKDRYTATGHDLSNRKDREIFYTGLERERYKIGAVIEKLGGRKNNIELPSTPRNNQYMQDVSNQIGEARSLEHIGDILRDPAPHEIR
eukprot:Seg2454.7 transcript_id=Seg2454.7/GoldUCD/mRNA.D3Y31 product="Protein translocase subunit SecA" protein_id=Seg2454.7/GoldUCD/D3Y31